MASEYQVTLNDMDVTKWVNKLSTTPLLKPEWGQIPSLKNMTIVMRSDDYFFTPIHPVSILHNVDLNNVEINVSQFGETIWSGTIADTQMDLKSYRCTLVCETALQKSLNQIARIDTTLLTAAEAARNLLILYNVPYDAGSFNKAIDYLDDIPARIRMNPSILDWDGTLGDLLQTIATAGIGRFYLTAAGSIGFDTYRLNTSPVIAITVTDQDLFQWPKLINENMDPIEGYAVQTIHQNWTFGDTDKRKTFNFGAESAVTVEDSTTAIYIGETWITLSNREYIRMDLHVRKAVSLVVVLGTYIQIDSFKLGMDRPAEVIGIDNSDERFTRFTVRIDKAVL